MSDPFLRGCPIAVGARDRNLDALYSFLVWKMPPYVSCFLPFTLMATPSSPPASPIPEYHSNAEDLTESSNLRKRAREPSRDNSDEGFWDLTDDGRPKTRRVNPQRLAIRLGPDLVAEMEELIVPGAKMPTFAVRKDFQERYCVDRRHIYDYFHSRGLRVAKEDKHTNLIRGRAMKAQAQAQAQLAAKATSDKIKEESPSFETALGSPSEEVKENFACPKPRGRPATGRKVMKAQSKKPRTAPRSAATTVKRRKFIGPLSDSQDVYDGSQLQTDITPKLSSSGTDTDSDTETPCPEFSHPCDSSTEETLSTPGSLSASTSLPDFLPSPDDYVAGYYEFTGQPRDSSILDMESTGSGLLDYGCNLDENLLMNELGRGEGYGSVPSNVEPALAGFSEAYYDSTNQCLQPYYDDLMSVSRQSSASGVKNMTMPADSPMTMDLPDLRKWLVDDFDFSPTVMDSREYNLASDTLYAANERDPFLPGPHGYNPGTYNPQNL
ncbi:hypothetical protein D9613_004150 [Agrocybe pediades]|uniref:Uncharacterized protein n=1 Tax=Agrocybe pediades TaxID=84607 RepID=A0A8H4QIK2_9AGAR|nr:hypothetical protein D9613_004150 [Agrocybe pediades]